MHPLLQLVNMILNMVSMALVVWIVISWLIAFNILNRSQTLVYRVNDALSRLFEPALKRIRPYMPDLGGVDISPIVLWLIIFFVQSCVNYYAFN